MSTPTEQHSASMLLVDIPTINPTVQNDTPLRHRQYAQVKKWLEAKVPIWLWGAPGAGKTHLGEQIATDLGLPFWPIYLGPTSTESKILGFNNASLGQYVIGLAYEPYVNGGLLFLDEIDNCDPSVLVSTNSLLANKTYRFPDGKIVKRHPDFRLVAAANTLGTGSKDGFKRNAQDAASRSRFIKLEFQYDQDLEMLLAGGEAMRDWVEYCHKVRAFVKTLAKCNLWITTREIIHGSMGLQAGITAKEIVDCTLFAEMPADVRIDCVRQCGEFIWPKPKAKSHRPVQPPSPETAAKIDAEFSKLSEEEVYETQTSLEPVMIQDPVMTEEDPVYKSALAKINTKWSKKPYKMKKHAPLDPGQVV